MTAVVQDTEMRRKLRFRLVHILYAITLLCVSISIPQLGVILFGLAAIGLWAAVYTSTWRPRTLGKACVAGAAIGYACFILDGGSGVPREAAQRMACANNLKVISLALHNYHDAYGSFPPAYLADSAGRPAHSWRILLLPFLDEMALYERYDFDEPWNGPNNRKLLQQMPDVYACPNASEAGAADGCTSYLAATGAGTAWPASDARSINEILDGTSGTILVIEHLGDPPYWLEPRDVDLHSVLTALTASDPPLTGHFTHESYLYDASRGRYVAFADGSVHFLEHDPNEVSYPSLFSVADGKPRPPEFWNQSPADPVEYPRRLRPMNVLFLAIWGLLVVLPAPWVWLNPRSATKPD